MSISKDTGMSFSEYAPAALRGGWLMPVGISRSVGGETVYSVVELGSPSDPGQRVIHCSRDGLRWEPDPRQALSGTPSQIASGRIVDYASNIPLIWSPSGWIGWKSGDPRPYSGGWDGLLPHVTQQGDTVVLRAWSDSLRAWILVGRLAGRAKTGSLLRMGSRWLFNSDSLWLLSADGLRLERCVRPGWTTKAYPSPGGDAIWFFDLYSRLDLTLDTGKTWSRIDSGRSRGHADAMLVSRDTLVMCDILPGAGDRPGTLWYTFDRGQTWGQTISPEGLGSLVRHSDGAFLAGGVLHVLRVTLPQPTVGIHSSLRSAHSLLFRVQDRRLSVEFPSALSGEESWQLLSADGRVLASGRLAAGATEAAIPAVGSGVRLLRLRGSVEGAWLVVVP